MEIAESLSKMSERQIVLIVMITLIYYDTRPFTINSPRVLNYLVVNTLRALTPLLPREEAGG